MGLFWLPSENVRNADRVEGVLKLSAEGTCLELDSKLLHAAFSLAPATREAWQRRIVGKLAGGLFVSMNRCDHTGTTFHSMRRKPRMAFTVSGHVFVSNDEDLVLPGKISAHQAYVEIVGLPEWFASALSFPAPSIPYATGIPLTRNAWVEAKCDDRGFEMNLDDDFKLHIHNTLYWGSKGLFDLNVRQATVAQIRTAGLVTADCMLEKVRPLVALVRFLSGENCVIRNACLFRMDRTLPKRYGGGAVGVRLLTSEQGHQFAGWGEMLFRWRDIAGHENTIIRNWYRLYAEETYALRLLDRVVSQGESAEGGIVLMVGAMEALASHTEKKKRYEEFLRNLGLESRGINVATMGKWICKLRNAPAHGRELPKDPDIVSIYRFVVAAMRVYFLTEMGFSDEQVFRIAQRHRGVREGLGLPEENLETDALNEMLKPGWIMEGRAIRERHD